MEGAFSIPACSMQPVFSLSLQQDQKVLEVKEMSKLHLAAPTSYPPNFPPKLGGEGGRDGGSSL